MGVVIIPYDLKQIVNDHISKIISLFFTYGCNSKYNLLIPLWMKVKIFDVTLTLVLSVGLKFRHGREK